MGKMRVPFKLLQLVFLLLLFSPRGVVLEPSQAPPAQIHLLSGVIEPLISHGGNGVVSGQLPDLINNVKPLYSHRLSRLETASVMQTDSALRSSLNAAQASLWLVQVGTGKTNIDTLLRPHTTLRYHIAHTLSPSLYLIHMSMKDAHLVNALPQVSWVHVYHPEYKVSSALLDDAQISHAANAPRVKQTVEAPLEEGASTPWQASLDVSIQMKQGASDIHVKSGEPLELIAVVADIPGWTEGDTNRLASEWKHDLQSTAPYVHTVHAYSSRLIGITVLHDADCIRDVTAFAAADRSVLLIEPRMHFTLLNYEVSSITLEGHARDASNVDSLSLHRRGLDGTGELIAITDTGIDFSSCFFNDPNYAGPTLNNDIGLVEGHRKIHSLFRGPGADLIDGDVPDGHGSHVCGTAAGSARSSDSAETQFNSKYNGVAPGAKLSVVSAASGDDVILHPDIRRTLFPKGYDSGARIFSNSWGCLEGVLSECNAYTSTAEQVDLFMWENRDALFVFAVGNLGTSQRTALAPAIAKNVIAVGATVTSNSGLVASTQYEDQPLLRSQYNNILCQQSPTTECCPSCFATENECCAYPQTLRCCPERQSAVYKSSPEKFDYTNLAYFSSLGPSGDGRVKPDLVAPGLYTVSARSDGDTSTQQCGLERPETGNSGALIMKAGTSMSAPAVGGSAAIVRQYFRQGYYPSNERNPDDALTPSGALIKGVLIHASRPLEGGVVSASAALLDLPVDYPSIYYGYGRLHLGSVLNNRSRLFVNDALGFSESGSSERTCIRAASRDQPVRVTLVYTDYPGSPVNRGPALVNDLNLAVRHIDSDTFWWGNEKAQPDNINNVEQVTLEEHRGGYYSIEVLSEVIVQGPQPYALVITGAIVESDPTLCPRQSNTGKVFLALGLAAGGIVFVALAIVFIVGYRRRVKKRRRIARDQARERRRRTAAAGVVEVDERDLASVIPNAMTRGRPGETVAPPSSASTPLPPIAVQAIATGDLEHHRYSSDPTPDRSPGTLPPLAVFPATSRVGSLERHSSQGVRQASPTTYHRFLQEHPNSEPSASPLNLRAASVNSSIGTDSPAGSVRAYSPLRRPTPRDKSMVASGQIR